MAANLKVTSLGDRLFTHFVYFEEDGVPWHRTGIPVKKLLSARKALTTVQGDKPATIEFLQWADGSTARSQGIRDHDGVKLAEVGPDYHLFQFTDEADAFDRMLGGKELVRTCGLLGQGEEVFFSALIASCKIKLYDRMTDAVNNYLVSRTGHGKRAITRSITSIRPVCENTLTLGESAANLKGQAKIVHKANVHVESRLVADAFAKAGILVQDAADAFQVLADAAIGEGNDPVASYAELVFPWEGEGDPPTRLVNKRDELIDAYTNAPGQDQPASAWRLFNAATWFNDNVLAKGRWAQTQFQPARQEFRQTAYEAALLVAGRN